ncbi:MAG: AsmA family protein, partial [Candidatus Gastranaerophilaceae bacterium]
MQIKRFLIRFFCGTALFLFCLYLAVIAAFPKYINSVQFKDLIEMELNKQTGLHVGIENIIIKPALSPYINIHANHIGLLYPDKKELLKIKDMTIKIKVLPILKKKIYLDKIIIERPIIAFTIDKDGNCTLDRYLKTNFIPQSKIAGFSFEKNIPNIEINRYKIKAYDKMYKEPFIIEGKRLLVEQPVFKNGLKIQTNGEISHNEKRYINYTSDIEAPVYKLSDKLFAQNPFRYIEKYQINSNVISKLKIKENGKKTQLFGTAEINNLSFKIDNIILNKNHIDCKFENDKIIINADLKTDQTNHLTVFGHYAYGKNKNIDLTVKAENANIATLKNTLETILNALNIKNNFSEYNAKGKINLNFKIKSNFKSLKSEGFAEILNANVSSKKFKYSVSGINSKINFENNAIKIENSKLLIENTPVIISGKIDSKTNLNILAKSHNLDAEKLSKIFLPEEIKQQAEIKGNIDFSAEIKGKAKSPKIIVNTELNNVTVINNKKTIVQFLSGKLNYIGDTDKPKGELVLNKVNILPFELSNALKANTLKFYITPNVIDIPENTFLYGGTPFVAAGKITEYTDKNPKYELSVNGKVASKQLYSYLKKSGVLKDIQMAPKGNLSIQGKITGKGNNSSLKAKIKADKNNYMSSLVIKELLTQPSVTIIDAEISKNNIITIKELS